MTNEEKAKRIALDKQLGTSSGFLETYLIAYESAMAMAEWMQEQHNWKPTEKQLDELWKIIPHVPNCEDDINTITELTSLYEDLKKL